MNGPFTIKEVEDDYSKFANGEGHTHLDTSMPDEIILKIIKNSISKAKGASFKVTCHEAGSFK